MNVQKLERYLMILGVSIENGTDIQNVKCFPVFILCLKYNIILIIEFFNNLI